MASDPPDTDQATRSPSRRIRWTRPGDPSDDAVGLGLSGHPSRDDGSTDAWARPPHAAPARVSTDGHGPDPETTPGDRHDARSTPPPRLTPSRP